MVNIYHWPKIETLADYAHGEAIAVADTKVEAIEAIIKDLKDCSIVPHDRLIKGMIDELVSLKPVIYKAPHGFAIWGSA